MQYSLFFAIEDMYIHVSSGLDCSNMVIEGESQLFLKAGSLLLMTAHTFHAGYKAVQEKLRGTPLLKPKNAPVKNYL